MARQDRVMRHLRTTLGIAATLAAAGALAAAPAVRAAAHPSAHTAVSLAECKRGYYENSSGRCVRRPVRASRAPAGATAKCRDGTYSFSQHASGTCSHHGGVAIWIHHP